MIKIAITGPESTGKTTLAQQLAKDFNEPYVPEYAREYLSFINRDYTYSDVLKIAEEQYKKEQQKGAKAKQVIFCDTGLLVLRIWLADKFDEVPTWIDDTLANGNYDYFLLMEPDLPWEADRFREDPERVEELFKTYKDNLNNFQLTYQSINGQGIKRFNRALASVQRWLNH